MVLTKKKFTTLSIFFFPLGLIRCTSNKFCKVHGPHNFLFFLHHWFKLAVERVVSFIHYLEWDLSSITSSNLVPVAFPDLISLYASRYPSGSPFHLLWSVFHHSLFHLDPTARLLYFSIRLGH